MRRLTQKLVILLALIVLIVGARLKGQNLAMDFDGNDDDIFLDLTTML